MLERRSLDWRALLSLIFLSLDSRGAIIARERDPTSAPATPPLDSPRVQKQPLNLYPRLGRVYYNALFSTIYLYIGTYSQEANVIFSLCYIYTLSSRYETLAAYILYENDN